MKQMAPAIESIEKSWQRIWAIINGRRIDVVLYFGSTVKWISRPNKNNSLWCAYPITMNNAFVDITEKGYEIYMPAMIHESKGSWLAEVRLHDVLTKDQFADWVQKINKFPYV